MVYLLGLMSCAAAYGLFVAARKLRAAGKDDAILYAIVTQALWLAGVVSVVAALFVLLQFTIASTGSSALVAGAFTAEQRLDDVNRWVGYVRLPWNVSVTLLFALFLLSLPGTLSRHEAAGRVARAALLGRGVLKRYSRVITTANVLVAIATSVSVFGTVAESSNTEFRARIKATRDQIAQVGSAAREVAAVEARAAVIRAVVSTPPPPVQAMAEDLVRTQRAEAEYAGEQAEALSRLRLVSRQLAVEPPGRSARAAEPERASDRPFERASTAAERPAPDPFETATFGEVAAAAQAVADHAATDTYRDSVRLVVELETRKAFTGAVLKKSVQAPLSSAIVDAGWSPLGGALADAVIETLADAVTRRVEAAVAAVVIKHFGPRPEGSPERSPFHLDTAVRTAVRGDGAFAGVIAAAWARAIQPHAATLEREHATATRRRLQIEAARRALSARSAVVRSRLEQRRAAALARLEARLGKSTPPPEPTPRNPPFELPEFRLAQPLDWTTAFDTAWLQSPRQRAAGRYLDARRQTDLSYDDIERLEREVAQVEQGTEPDLLRTLLLPSLMLGAGAARAPGLNDRLAGILRGERRERTPGAEAGPERTIPRYPSVTPPYSSRPIPRTIPRARVLPRR